MGFMSSYGTENSDRSYWNRGCVASSVYRHVLGHKQRATALDGPFTRTASGNTMANVMTTITVAMMAIILTVIKATVIVLITMVAV
jgi:hypothetical protein